MAIHRYDPPPGKAVYAATDFHLGSPSYQGSLERERRLVAWLEHVAPTAEAILLLGDTFDFWFEWRRAIPKGFTRLLGCLARLVDAGVPVIAFTGNHDMWMFGYLEQEVGLTILREPTQMQLGRLQCLIGHGDGLGPGDGWYKFLKGAFASPLCQWAFSILHPDLGLWIAHRWSGSSRAGNAGDDAHFKGEREHIWQYCQAQHKQLSADLYLFGHRHLTLALPVGERSLYLNLGDWFARGHYAAFTAEGLQLFSEDHQAVDALRPSFARAGFSAEAAWHAVRAGS